MKNLNWFQARDLAQGQGRAVRREAWRKWLYYTPWYLWFIAETDTSNVQHRRVVQNSDFGSAEFLANDWTDEPWPDDPSGVNGPTTPPTTPGDNWGPWPPTFHGQPQPLPPVWIIGGGGPLPSGPPTDPTPWPPPAPTSTPTINVSVDYIQMDGYDSEKDCFQDNGGGNYSGNFSVTVSISGGPAGIGTLSVQLGGQTQLGTAFDGYNNDFEFDGISFSPGGSLTATANYSINGQTFSGSGSYQIPDTCQPDYSSDSN